MDIEGKCGWIIGGGGGGGGGGGEGKGYVGPPTLLGGLPAPAPSSSYAYAAMLSSAVMTSIYLMTLLYVHE